MITEIKVDGVGCLRDLASEKSLRSNVLVHGENGAGKSTIAAVFRSLQRADVAIVLDRLTVGDGIDAAIELTTEAGVHSFADGSWSKAFSQMHVFDQAFVNANIHSGDLMSNDHGKRLYSIVLGESCGDRLQEAEILQQKVDEQNTHLRGITKELESHAPSGMTLDQFMAIQESKSLASDIQRQEERIESLRKRKKLDRAQTFQMIELPAISASFDQVLKKTIGNFLDNAEQLVFEHIESHSKKATVAWIEQGNDFSNDEDCPFCGAALSKNDLVAAYKGFFSRDYNTLKAEINSLHGLVDKAYGERVMVNQQKVLSENNASREFWEDYVEVPPLDESIFEEIDDEIGRAREKLNDLADKKKQNPLDEIEMTVDLEFSSSLQERIEDYNTLVGVANERIEELRASQSEEDLDGETAKLVSLKATQTRFLPEVIELIDDWEEGNKQKSQLAKNRKTLQKKVQEETEAVFASRGELINELLKSFDAGFTLGEFDTNNRTKPPSVQLRVCFGEGDSVRLDDKASKSERPFDASLSSGERNMLAFAFFLTNLTRDQDVGNKVVVVDDPITNLDTRRLARTAEMVGGISEMAEQLIVLSHSIAFLNEVADHIKEKGPQRLTLTKDGDKSVMSVVKTFD